MSLLEGVGLLVLLDIFELVPDGRRAGVSVIQQGHTRRLRVEELQLHILLNACRDLNEKKVMIAICETYYKASDQKKSRQQK